MGTISEIILHIGLEKTGTTSIQMFLDEHKAALRAQGVVCSGCLGWYNHKLLAAYGMADGSRDIAVTSAGIGGPPAHQAFRARTRGHVLAEIERTDATRYLLTSEDLSRLTSIDDIRRVHALLSEICANIRVIVFLRRQDRLAVSRYYSLLINGNLPPAVFPSPEHAGYYDYAALLGAWADVFGDHAIRIVAYPETPRHRAQTMNHKPTPEKALPLEGEGWAGMYDANGGNTLAPHGTPTPASIEHQPPEFDAIGAFCDAAGITLPTDRRGSARHDNASLDVISQTILQTINRQGSLMSEKARARRLLDALRAADRGTPGALASAAQARAFHERHAAGNAALAQRFGLPQPLFNDDFAMYPDAVPAPADLAGAALERMAAVTATLLARAL